MCSKQQLKNFLEGISVDAKFPVFNYVSPEKYTILIKCRVEKDRGKQFYNDYTKVWIHKFSIFTKTGWIVRSCFPHLKRLVYRKVYTCALSRFNKKKSPIELLGKNKGCTAKIDFKMKFINRNTIKNDKSLKEGLNLNIYIDFTHTHGLTTAKSFYLLKCPPETDRVFEKYLMDGYTPLRAKYYHDLLLISKYGDTDDALHPEVSPTLKHITYLLKKKIKEVQNINDRMAAKKRVLEESGGVLNYTDDNSIIVVITPFMKNVLTGHDLDHIIIDSTPLKEGVVSFLFVASPLGALPIACTLHSHNTESSYSQAFFSTKLLIEHEILKSFEPKSIIINAIEEQKHALDAIFSNNIVFISRASMAEEIWKKIIDIETKIDGSIRHKLMSEFYSLLNAENNDEFDEYYKELEKDKTLDYAPDLKENLIEMWYKRKEFMEQIQNKLIDISVRTTKQFLLNKCNYFTNVIMIDVLLNILDKHWCQILHALLKRKLVIETFTKFLSKDIAVMNMLDMEISASEYRLEGDKKSKKNGTVIFRSDTMFCDCVKGRKGQLCEHLCAILHSIEIIIDLPEEKIAFYTALAGEEIQEQEQIIKAEPDSNDEPGQDDDDVADDVMEQLEDVHQSDEYYCVVKQEIEDKADPLDNNETDLVNDSQSNPVVCKDYFTSSGTIVRNEGSMKKCYENALKALNDEFRRLNKVFRENPNVSNLDTMGRLARELSKIRPIEKLNLKNVYVEVNDKIIDNTD